MATRPTVGGSDGTWGTELNAHLDVSLDADGKVDDGAAQTTSAAPGADAELANKKYVDDQITALETKIQPSQVIGTTDITRNAGTYDDMTDMEITITTTGGDVLLMFTAPFFNGSGPEVGLRFDIDGTPTSQLAYSASGNRDQLHIHWLETSLSSASHTFKVQWKDISATAGQRGSTDGPRVFTAIELP